MYVQIDLTFLDAHFIERLKRYGHDTSKTILFVAVDCLSCYCMAFPIANKSAASCREAMSYIINFIGRSNLTVQTDQGSEFRGEFDDYLNFMGVKHVFSKPREPNQNGQVEHTNGSLKDIMYNPGTQYEPLPLDNLLTLSLCKLLFALLISFDYRLLVHGVRIIVIIIGVNLCCFLLPQ